MRIAVLRNAGSFRNRGQGAPDPPEGLIRVDLSGIDQLSGVLSDLHRTGFDLLVIDGGDGTVREVVSRLPEVFAGEMPMLGVMARGNTNLIARKCGCVPDYRALVGLLEAPVDEVRSAALAVPMLRIDGLAERPVRGFIAGWGAYASGTRIARQEIAARGGRQVVRAVLATLRRALFGADAADLRRGVRAEMRIDAGERGAVRRFIGIATTLRGSLVAGLNPFWGSGGGPIRWLDVTAPPRRLMLAAPCVAFGKPMGWMNAAGYGSGRAERIRLAIEDGIVVDGEIFATDPEKPLTLSAHEQVRILAL